MNGIECLGEFHVFFSVCFALKLWQLKRKEKKQVFAILYLICPLLLPHKKKKYIVI